MAGGYRENLDSYAETDEEQGSIISMLITLIGLIAAAAVICSVVWVVTHKQPKQDIGTIQLQDTPPLAETLVESQASSEPITQEKEKDVDTKPVSGDATMEFKAVEDEVTARDVAVVRSVPNTDGISSVVGQLMNGQKLKRTGVNREKGWSKVMYNGQEAYVASYMITNNLDYKPEGTEMGANRVTTSDGRVIIFEDCDDWITAKEYVNLRSEPSTSQGKATVSGQLSSGSSAKRTGISADSGWSRVEINGQVLYVVSSYIQQAQQ